MSTAMAGIMATGDRPWSEAGATTLSELAAEVRDRAKAIHGNVDADAVHDMRTATRRLRTAIDVFGGDAPKRERKMLERELRRVARRLGEVRDLDVLIEALGEAPDIDPLRKAWRRQRRGGARRLKKAVRRPGLERALEGAAHRVPSRVGTTEDPGTGIVPRISSRAPALVWAAFGQVLAHELDPLTADPPVIHELRKDAKRLRYTLEVFEHALRPGAQLIVQLMALQDAGGEMHDAIVGRDTARATARSLRVDRREARAIEAFAAAQDRRAEACRPIVARELSAVRSRAFRESLSRALAGMGHVEPIR